jgi:DNA primase
MGNADGSGAFLCSAPARCLRRRLLILKERGLSGEVAARFGLGYAPAGWRSSEAAVPDYAASVVVEAGTCD